MSNKSMMTVWLALILTIFLAPGAPGMALAQCGGGSGSMGSMHDQHMSSGQMGMYGSQAPVQQSPAAPSYVSPVPPAVSGYAVPQTPGGYGQMTGQGGPVADHSGHAGH